MGAFNFSVQSDLSVGVVMPCFSDDEIEEYRQSQEYDFGEAVTSEEAEKWLYEAEDEEITYKYNHALKFQSLMMAYIGSEFWGLGDWFDLVEGADDALSIEIEEGYHDGFQMYLQVKGADDLIEEILQEVSYRKGWFKNYDRSLFREISGFNNTKELKAHLLKVEAVCRAALAVYAWDYGLGLTSGGWCGGVSFEGVAAEKDRLIAECDPQMWQAFKQWWANNWDNYFSNKFIH